MQYINNGRISREELHKVLQQYDIAIIPLRKRIYGSVPSKIFEYSKLGLPILYFGGGEGEGLVNNNNLGWVAKAGDYNTLNSIISQIDKSKLSIIYRRQIQKTAYEKFSLEDQLKKVLKSI